MLKKIIVALGMAAATVASFIYMDYRQDRESAVRNIANSIDDKRMEKLLSDACAKRVDSVASNIERESCAILSESVNSHVSGLVSKAKSMALERVTDELNTKLSNINQTELVKTVLKDVKKEVRETALEKLNDALDDVVDEIKENFTITKF